MYPIEGPIIPNVMREAHSALPDAPTLARETSAVRRDPRTSLARTLRRIADRLEPPGYVDHAFQPLPR